MPTYREHEITNDEVVVEDVSDTVDTVVRPPMPPIDPALAPPPPVPPPAGYPATEHVVLEDAEGTRVVSRDVPPGYPLDEDPRRYNWLAPTLVVICLAALGIVLAAILLGQDDDKDNARPATTATAQPPPVSQTVVVPTTVGQGRNAAESALKGAGFTVVVATVPGPAPAGQVLAQNPTAGETASTGDTVRINVSNGEQTGAQAPATQTPATQTPATQTPATQTPANETPATDTPATQPPASQTQTPEPSTTATPSENPPAQAAAPTSVSVPALSGDVKSAVQRLVSAGLLASIQYVPGEDPLGTVTAQSPSEGTTAKTGAHVTLSVSSGPGQKEQMTVPDATGQTVSQAVDTMNAAGLRVITVKKTVADQEQAGDVVEQTPAPGAKAPKNAQILVAWGAFKG